MSCKVLGGNSSGPLDPSEAAPAFPRISHQQLRKQSRQLFAPMLATFVESLPVICVFPHKPWRRSQFASSPVLLYDFHSCPLPHSFPVTAAANPPTRRTSPADSNAWLGPRAFDRFTSKRCSSPGSRLNTTPPSSIPPTTLSTAKPPPFSKPSKFPQQGSPQNPCKPNSKNSA